MVDIKKTGEIKLGGDDFVLPYQVEALDVRGRAVQLGPMLNTIFARHDYPEPVAALLSEMITLTVLLGTSLKFDGKFIVQTQSDGPVSLLVVDFTAPDAVRAYARYDDDQVSAAVSAGKTSPPELLGEGVMAMTIDQGPSMQTYQGIVKLDGSSLEEVACQYFRQSEQIPTQVKLAAAQIYIPNENGHGSTKTWRAGGLLCQFLPESPERMRQADLPGGDNPNSDEDEFEPDEDDAWLEAKALVDTIGDDELTDPQITSERLLYRLFHENGVRAYEGREVLDKCSCSREKVVAMVKSFSMEDIDKSFENGDVETTCEFCNTVYSVSRKDVEAA